MTWFWLSLAAMLFWSGSDLFSKIGCSAEKDKHAHLRMTVAVGAVMGLHAMYEIFIGGVEINWQVMLDYLPVSLLYIGSMILGYMGLRYIELSISSPICNSSGAIVSIICLATGMTEAINGWQWGALACVCLGVVGLGVVESNEDPDLRARRQEKANRKYAKSWLAICLPLAYCLLDALGTFADSLVLAEPADLPTIWQGFGKALNEDSANVAYELTFLAIGAVCFIYLLIKKDLQKPKQARPRLVGAVCETIGQFAYIYALADTEHAAFAAPIICAYCVLSVVWSRIFLKEKLSLLHYLCILLTFIGIIILGVFDA